MRHRLTRGALDFGRGIARLGLSQAEVADDFNVTPTCIHDWRTGRRIPQAFAHIEMLRDKYGVEPKAWGDLTRSTLPVPIPRKRPARSRVAPAAPRLAGRAA